MRLGKTANVQKKVYCVFNNGQPDIISDEDSRDCSFDEENNSQNISLEDYEISDLAGVDLERLQREVEALESYPGVLADKAKKLDCMIEDS
jgi:hypothetical protein